MIHWKLEDWSLITSSVFFSVFCFVCKACTNTNACVNVHSPIQARAGTLQKLLLSVEHLTGIEKSAVVVSIFFMEIAVDCIGQPEMKGLHVHGGLSNPSCSIILCPTSYHNV